MSSKYIDGVDAVTGATRTLARLADVLGVEATPVGNPAALAKTSQGSLSKFLGGVRQMAPADIKDGIGTLAGAALGALLWREHRVLGFFAGASVGRNVPALAKNDQRRMALCNLGITSAGVLGSLTVPKHPTVGFVLGWLSGGVLSYASGCNPVGGAK